MNRITSLLDSEPVLSRIVPVVTALVIYLVARGLIDRDTASLLIAMATAVVGGGAVAAAREKVTPTIKLTGGSSADHRDV